MADLTPNAVKVLQGFSNLDYTERTQLMDFLADYQKNVNNEYRGQLVKIAAARAGVPLGPTSEGGCPCCGK